MKILLLTACYPPDPQVGSLRARKVAEALRAAGHEVVVVTPRLPGEAGPVRAAMPGLTVHTVRAIPSPRYAYLWLRDRLRIRRRVREAAAAHAAAPRPDPASQAPAWKRLILSLLHLPDDEQGFILPAVLCAHRVARDADLVYSTAPPHSVHLAGLLLRRWFRVRWVAEFRDPWFDSVPDPRVGRIERALRTRCLRAADEIVAVSEGGRAWLSGKAADAGAAAPVLLARNGIDRIGAPESAPSRGAPVRIVHVGTLYLRRDPRPFIRALAALRHRLRLEPDDLGVDFVGRATTFHGMSVASFAAELGVADLIRFHERVPHGEAQALIADADLLLLLAQRQPLQVPNKLYEYLGARKPILAFVDAEGESAAMLRRAGSHYLVTTDDPDGTERVLERAYVDLRDGRPFEADLRVLEEWSVERQMEQLLLELGLAAPAPGESTPALAAAASANVA